MHVRYHNAELLVAHELHQPWDDASFHNHFDPVIIAVRKVRDGPARVGQNVCVGEMEQLDQRGKHLWNKDTKLNPGQQTCRAEALPAGLQTGVDKGSCFDTSWTTSTSGYGGIQPIKLQSQNSF